MEIRFRARVGHAHTLEIKALAQERGVAGFVGGGGTEREADFVKGGEDGGADDGVGMSVEAGGKFAYEVGVSGRWLV